MTAFWTYDNLARVTGGTWLAPPADGGAVLPAAQRDAGPIIWHDTRDLEPGQCYLAVKGENFDGHDFVEQAFENGAALALVNSSTAPQTRGIGAACPILAVPDTVTALQDLARVYRDELAQGTCKVIGVAGSNGKTTTRHLIHHVLTHAGKTGTQSPKSFNNHLGVPLTLLAARPTDDFVACEIGTNHPGEIDFLSAIARPDIAVITSIGEEHLEFFKTVANVASEEASIMSHVVPAGWVFAPEEDWDRYLAKRFNRSDLEIAHGPSDVEGGWHVWLDRGVHMVLNARLAVAVALRLGVDNADCSRAMLDATLPPGRGELLVLGDIQVIHDAYNANPTSTAVAISEFGLRERLGGCGRKVIVFGDMLELGDRAPVAHRSVGIQAESDEIDLLVCIGHLAKGAAELLEHMQSHTFEHWTDDLPDQVAALLRPGDTVLLKASRGMRLERLIPAIEKRFGKAESPQPVE